MTNSVQNNITIIGGGMVGMSLALLLSRQRPDWKIALIDALEFPTDEMDSLFQPSFDSRSTAIAHGSKQIFESLGVWQQLNEQATAINRIHVSDAGHFLGGLINAKDYGVDAVGYVIPNQWMGRVLGAALKKQPNLSLLSATVEKVIPKMSGAELSLLDNSQQIKQVTTDLVVMADGGKSPLAQQLGIDFSVESYQQTAIIANVEFSQPHQHIAFERFTELGPIALLPLGKSAMATEAALVLTLPNDQADELLKASDEFFLAHLQQRFGQRLGKFIRVGERKAFPLQLITAKEQIRSHLVLIGNAAHFLHPVAGQGFNLSLRDCLRLTKYLAASSGSLGELSVLENYLQDQQRDQNTTIFFSDQLVKIFSNAKLPLVVLRHLGFFGLESVPVAKKILVDQTMGKYYA
jgi:2-polyprenyl-6-methoxyphenol 4-hydroxylase